MYHTGQCAVIHRCGGSEIESIASMQGSFPCEERDDFIWGIYSRSRSASAGFTKAAPAPRAAPGIGNSREHYKLAYLTGGTALLGRPRDHCLMDRRTAVRSSGMVVAEPALIH